MSLPTHELKDALTLATQVLQQSRPDFRGYIELHTPTGMRMITPDDLRTLAAAMLMSTEGVLQELAQCYQATNRAERALTEAKQLHEEQLSALTTRVLQWRNKYDQLDAELREHLLCTE